MRTTLKVVKNLDIFLTKNTNGSTHARCSNGYTRIFQGYTQKEILSIIKADNFK